MGIIIALFFHLSVEVVVQIKKIEITCTCLRLANPIYV